MSGFSAQAFLAAQFQGQQLRANLDKTQATTELEKQQTQSMKQDMQMKQTAQQQQLAQQQALAAIVSKQDSTLHENQVQDGEVADVPAITKSTQEAQNYRQIGKTLLVTDPAKAASYYKLAQASEKNAADLTEKGAKIEATRAKETSAYAGAVLDGSVNPQEAFQWVKSHISLKDAMQMPNPSDPEAYKAWWKTKQTAGISAEAQMNNKRQVEATAQASADRKEALNLREQEHQDARADRAISREMLLNSRQQAAADRTERLAAAADDKKFKQTEVLNTKVQREAKPLLEDLSRIRTVEGLLKIDSSAGDQQIRQGLTDLMGSFKGRATNLYYKDNKNFGDVVDKLNGVLSRSFTGRYSDNDRRQIRDLVSQMRKNSIEPTLANLEKGQKEHAKKYGLDADQVEVQGDFDRQAKAPVTKYPEGSVATNAKGEKVMLVNGKWIAQ